MVLLGGELFEGGFDGADVSVENTTFSRPFSYSQRQPFSVLIHALKPIPQQLLTLLNASKIKVKPKAKIRHSPNVAVKKTFPRLTLYTSGVCRSKQH